MAYTVLARKYRSQTFDDVVGQEPIARTLKNAIKTDRVAHAYLFTGTRGVGKTTMARVLAKSLNCLSSGQPTIEPCCRCDSCTAINIGEDIDVIEIDGASNNGVEEVRRLRENAIYRPARARFKIYIIDEVHMLSTSAFNALLKILEEPPGHVKFIFATTEPTKVIPTVRSRCQRFDFANISPAEISGQLEHILRAEGIEFESGLLMPLARMANGSMRDALSLLDRLISAGAAPLSVGLLEEYLGCPDSEKIYNLIEKIGQNDAAAVLAVVNELIAAGQGELQIVDLLIDAVRDVMVVKSAGADSEILILNAQQRKRCAELAEKFDIAGLVYSITSLEKLRWNLKNTDSPRALLEALVLRFALSEHFMNVDALAYGVTGTGEESVKKNEATRRRPATSVRESRDEPASPPLQSAVIPPELQSVKDNWRAIISAVRGKLGNGTAGILLSAEPTQFADGRLVLTFPAAASIWKRICQSGSRVEQIQTALSEYWKTPISITFEALESAKQNGKSAGVRKADEIINHPAVKTVLLGLDATITAVEQNPEEPIQAEHSKEATYEQHLP